MAGATLTASYLVYALEQTVAAAVQHAPPPVPTSSGAGWQFSGTVCPAAFLGRPCFGDRSRAAERTHTHAPKQAPLQSSASNCNVFHAQVDSITEMATHPRSKALDFKRLFLLTLPIHQAFCMVGVIVCGASTLLSPAVWYPSMLISIFFVMILGARLLVVHVPDQQRALTLFGRGWLLATLFGCISFVVGNYYLQLCTAVPDVCVFLLAALTGLVPVYLHLMGVHTMHQILNHLAIALAFWTSPQWSAMPHDNSTATMWLSLLIGDLVGMLAREKLLNMLYAQDTSTPEPHKFPPVSVSENSMNFESTEGAEIKQRLYLHSWPPAFDDPLHEKDYTIATACDASHEHDGFICMLMGGVALGEMVTAPSACSPMLTLYCIGLVVIRHMYKPARVNATASGGRAATEAAIARRSRHYLAWLLLCAMLALAMHFLLSRPRLMLDSVTLVGAFLILVVFQQWVASMQPSHRSATKVMFLLAVALVDQEPSSNAQRSMGILSNIGLCVCFLVFGELLGYSYDHVRRTAFIESQAHKFEFEQVELRAARAEATSKVLAKQHTMQSDLLDRIFATSHDALMLCELPAAPEQPPTLLRCSPNTHSILGVPADADVFTAFTAEQQRAIGADVELLAAQRFFPERIQTLAHNGVVLACSGHMVDDTLFLVTMRDVTEAKRSEQRERHVEIQRIQSAAQRAIEEAKAACDTLQKLDLASDLVTHLEIKNGTTTLLYCSASYEAVLGHQPKTCVGNVDGLTHLYPPSFLASQPRERAAAFESRRITDGSTMETPLLHADGHEIWFEERVKIDRRTPTSCCSSLATSPTGASATASRWRTPVSRWRVRRTRRRCTCSRTSSRTASSACAATWRTRGSPSRRPATCCRRRTTCRRRSPTPPRPSTAGCSCA